MKDRIKDGETKKKIGEGIKKLRQKETEGQRDQK
jgi:hypothetical protein